MERDVVAVLEMGLSMPWRAAAWPPPPWGVIEEV